MKKKTVSTIMLTLLFASMLMLAFDVQSVRASGTICIRADGSIDPPTANIATADNVTYTFTDDNYDSILVQRSNIVINGNGYTLQSIGGADGIIVFDRSNVTVKELEIKSFGYGINLAGASFCTVSGNNITNNGFGIEIHGSSNNNTFYGNNIANNDVGFEIFMSDNNAISGNNIMGNRYGVDLRTSYNNRFCHNNFIDNENCVYFHLGPCANIWDDGYPSGGNYWSDHVTVDAYSGVNQDEPGGDGIVDEPYIIDEFYRDHYPLIEPWTPVERKVGVKTDDWVKYSNFDVSWSSNDPDAAMPIGLSILSEVEWWENSVEDVLDTRIRYQQLLHFKDGSEYSTTCWIDTDTGSGTPLSLVSSNLVPDDCLYASAPWFAWKINETISHMCAGVNRETNHLNVTTSMQFGSPPAYPNTTGDFYWDKETGVLCELSMEHLNQTGSYMTSWSVFYEIVDTNLWIAPIPPTIIASLGIDPDILKLNSKGRWITCYIELPEGYEVGDIDVSTVMLNDSIPVSLLDVPAPDPVPTEIGDYDNDTIPDLMVKFNRTMVSTFILSQRTTDGVVTLTITGDVNGTPFKGADTIRVLMSGGGTGRRK